MDFDFKGFFRKYLISLGEDPDREGLKKTPQRVEDAYNFIFKQLRPGEPFHSDQARIYFHNLFLDLVLVSLIY